MSGYYKDVHRYDDMLDLPHHESKKRPHMSLHDRAAQFAPFAALNGHEAAIQETARLTEGRRCLDETEVERLNQQLLYLAEHPQQGQRVAVCYYKQDIRKEGGAYLTDIGEIRKIDATEGVLVLNSGIKLKMENIVGIEILQ